MATRKEVLSKEAGVGAISERATNKPLLYRPKTAKIVRNPFFLGFSASKSPKVPIDPKKDLFGRESLATRNSRGQEKLPFAVNSPKACTSSKVNLVRHIGKGNSEERLLQVNKEDLVSAETNYPVVKSVVKCSSGNTTLTEALYSQLSFLLPAPVRSGIPGFHRFTLSLPSHRPASASYMLSSPPSPLSRLVITGKGYSGQPAEQRVTKEGLRKDVGGIARSQSWYSLTTNPAAVAFRSSPQPSFSLHVTLPCQRSPASSQCSGYKAASEGQDGGNRRLVRGYWMRGKRKARRKASSVSTSPLPLSLLPTN